MTPSSALFFALTLMQSPPPPQADIALTLTCGQQPSEITLTIVNSGQADTAVLLGIALGNGRWYLPRELIVELKRTGRPDVEQLLYEGPGAIAGRIDPWVVTLPVRTSFIMTLSATDFISTSTVRSTAPPEEMRARLTGRPITADLNGDMTGMKSWRVWTGSAISNALRLADCPR